MLNEEEKKAIENLKEIINLSKEEIKNNDKNLSAILDLYDLKSLDIVLKLIIRLEKENELAKEQLKKRCEIADEINDLLVKVQKLQKENETTTKLNANMSQRHLNDTFKIKNYEKQIDLMSKYIDKCNYVDSEECQFQYEFEIKGCIEKGDCIDCIKQYFENKAKGENN